MKTTAFLFAALFSGVLFCNALRAQTPLLLNPELGQKYLLTTDINLVFNEEANEHREATENKGNASFSLFLTPEKINAAGNYDVKCQLQNLQYSFDKKKAEEPDELAKEREKNFESALRIMKENTFMLEISKKGELVGIKGFDEIYFKIMKSRGASDEEVAQIQSYKTERLGFIGSVISMMFNQLTGFYTEAAVKPGDVYTKTGNMNLVMISAQHTASYTIKEISKSGTYFTGEGNITMARDSVTAIVGKIKSDIQTNPATGLIEKATYGYEITSPKENENKDRLVVNISLAIKEAE